MGCALENLMLAAAANGYAATVTLFPGKLVPIAADGKPKLVARVELVPGKPEASELYEAIPRRHTNRGAYNPQMAIPTPFLESLGSLAGEEATAKIFLLTAESQRNETAEISSRANSELYSDPQVQDGSDQWIRTDWNSVQKYRDGLTIDAFGLPRMATAVAKTMPLSMLKRVASHEAKDGYAQLMLSAPLIGILAVRDRYDQQDCLRAGRIWQRAHLLATARGLAARPCNEAIEMIDHERALGKPAMRAGQLVEVLGTTEWQPTFLFYMGYPILIARASPRRPVDRVLL
jgi:nitroreductase